MFNFHVPAPVITLGEAGEVASLQSDRNQLSSADTAPAIRTTLQFGDAGDVVEALQRTLNVRVQPSPNLDVDGDFGPLTEIAVKDFQSHNGLKQSGIVDAATWKALGALVPSGEATPLPADQ